MFEVTEDELKTRKMLGEYVESKDSSMAALVVSRVFVVNYALALPLEAIIRQGEAIFGYAPGALSSTDSAVAAFKKVLRDMVVKKVLRTYTRNRVQRYEVNY